jgi:hypothetical protein
VGFVLNQRKVDGWFLQELLVFVIRKRTRSFKILSEQNEHVQMKTETDERFRSPVSSPYGLL